MRSSKGVTLLPADRSHANAVASIPEALSAALASSSSACLRATIAIFAPISPRASAMRNPSPREPPVTTATLPERSKSDVRRMGVSSLGIASVDHATRLAFFANVGKLGQRPLGHQFDKHVQAQILL